MNRKSVWQFLKDIFTQWMEDEPFLLASSLSYYTLFSLTPLLVIAVAVADVIFGREAAQNRNHRWDDRSRERTSNMRCACGG